ncbi:MAG: polysaccharide biosynthesis C-terminal domain-containing protein [Bacilli bacterium]|nr:polysaccharide biosynthesis C-terminal domain-containing protein [Bacilli bacterium]
MSKLKISDETNIARIEHKSKKNMAIGTIVGYLAILVSIAHGLILTPMIMNSVGVDNYGLYGIATTLTALFLMDFGLNTTTETYLAKLRASGNKDKVQRFLATIFRIYLLLSIAFVIIISALYFLSPIIYRSSYTPEQISTLQILIIIVGGYSLVSFPTNTFSSVITTYEKFGFNKFADLIQKLIYFGLTIACIKLNWGIIGITAVNAGSGIVAIIMRFFFMRYYLGVKLDPRLKMDASKKEIRSILMFSAWGLVIAILSRLVYNITPSILGMVSSSDQVSMFMLVNTIEGYVYMFGAMTGTFFMAKVARLEASGTPEEKREKLQSLAGRIGKLQFFVIALIIFGFATVGQEFISFWLRDTLVDYPEFANIYWCILAICAYELVRIPELPIYNAMLTEGHIRPLAIITIIKAIINVGLSFVLSSYYGAIGACAAIAAARIIDVTLNNFVYNKYLGISISRFFKDVYLRGLVTIVISFGLGLACHFFMPIENIIGKFMVNGIIFVITYIFCTLFITFNKNERHYYLNIFFEILHIKKRVEVDGVVPEVPDKFPEIEDLQKQEESNEENASKESIEEEKKEENNGQD